MPVVKKPIKTKFFLFFFSKKTMVFGFFSKKPLFLPTLIWGFVYCNRDPNCHWPLVRSFNPILMLIFLIIFQNHPLILLAPKDATLLWLMKKACKSYWKRLRLIGIAASIPANENEKLKCVLPWKGVKWKGRPICFFQCINK